MSIQVSNTFIAIGHTCTYTLTTPMTLTCTALLTGFDHLFVAQVTYIHTYTLMSYFLWLMTVNWLIFELKVFCNCRLIECVADDDFFSQRFTMFIVIFCYICRALSLHNVYFISLFYQYLYLNHIFYSLRFKCI